MELKHPIEEAQTGDNSCLRLLFYWAIALYSLRYRATTLALHRHKRRTSRLGKHEKIRKGNTDTDRIAPADGET